MCLPGIVCAYAFLFCTIGKKSNNGQRHLCLLFIAIGQNRLIDKRLITFARNVQKKGVTTMNFEVFGKSEMDKYKEEIKAKWGDTKAYQEYAAVGFKIPISS